MLTVICQPCPTCSRNVGVTQSTAQPRYRFHHNDAGHLCKMSGQPSAATAAEGSDA